VPGEEGARPEGAHELELTEELRKLVDALRSSIVELRAALGEAAGPFAEVLRRPAPEEEEREVLAPVSAPAVLAEKAAAKAVERAPAVERVEEKPAEVVLAAKQRAAGAGALQLRKSLKLLKLLHTLSDSVPPEQLDRYVKLLEKLGILDSRTAEVVEVLNEIVKMGREAGIDADDQIVAIYSIAKLMGAADPELEEEIAFSLAKKVGAKRAKREGSV